MTGEGDVEQHLVGGNFDCAVVRIGDTVRRRAGPWTPAVHALLNHLHSQGFGASPVPLGIDDKGREILSFIAGEVGIYPMLAHTWTGETLIRVGKMLRALHDLTLSFPVPVDAVWRTHVPDPGPLEVICHSDWTPYNAVFRDQKLVGFIDWDFAQPGSRLWDLAWAAHMWVPLRDDQEVLDAGFTSVPDRPARLRVLCAAYGLDDRVALLDVIRARTEGTADWIEAGAVAGDPTFVRLRNEGHADGYRRATRWFDANRESLAAGLA